MSERFTPSLFLDAQNKFLFIKSFSRSTLPMYGLSPTPFLNAGACLSISTNKFQKVLIFCTGTLKNSHKLLACAIDSAAGTSLHAV
ncbi:hypothetical protein [Enterobacter hormaechei]|uniref:hypothetical protein n=1 Tax=Enterobacter hormaechei TaxID=158836 RepID=UPI0030762E4E